MIFYKYTTKWWVTQEVQYWILQPYNSFDCSLCRGVV